MLVYWNGRMYYSTSTVWCTSALLMALLPAGVWLLRAEQCVLEEKWLVALDWVLAAFMVNGILTPVLQWNLTPSGRADLYVLRSVSAVLMSAALIALTVQSLTRTQLALSTALYVGISCNLASWSSALWLYMQSTGLGGLLPASVCHTLRSKPILEWLRDDYVTQCIQQARRLAPLVLLPAEHLDAALAVMPRELRNRLQQPLVAELPAPVRELVQPWQDGPGHLRVRPFCLPKLSLRESNSHHDNREPPADAVPSRPAVLAGRGINDVAPEWVYVYVLRHHLRTRFNASWTTEARRAALLALLAAAATSRLSARRGAVSARLALATGLAVFAAQTYGPQLSRRNSSSRLRGPRPPDAAQPPLAAPDATAAEFSPVDPMRRRRLATLVVLALVTLRLSRRRALPSAKVALATGLALLAAKVALQRRRRETLA